MNCLFNLHSHRRIFLLFSSCWCYPRCHVLVPSLVAEPSADAPSRISTWKYCWRDEYWIPLDTVTQYSYCEWHVYGKSLLWYCCVQPMTWQPPPPEDGASIVDSAKDCLSNLPKRHQGSWLYSVRINNKYIDYALYYIYTFILYFLIVF